MKKHLPNFILILLVFSLFLPIYSIAQTGGTLKLRLITETTGDMITSNTPIIKNFFMSGGDDKTLNIILTGSLNFTFADTDTHIGLKNGTGCTLPGDFSVNATEGTPFQFEVYSSQSATINKVVLPVGPTFSSGLFQWTPAAADIGTYLAVFEGTAPGLSTSQIVVMIKVNPAETISTPSFSSGPTSGSIGQTLTYTASGATVTPSNDPVQYNINWGDGTETGYQSGTSASHSWSAAGTYTVTLTARCATHQGVVSSSTTLQVVISAAPPTTYSLTVNISGSGTVTKSPDKTSYSANESVQLTANPGTGYTFSAWSGDLTGSTSPVTITMTGNKNITATFTQSTPSGETRYFNVQTSETFNAGETKTFSFTLNESTKNSLKLNLYGRSPTTNATYKWIFPDGTEFPLYFVQRGLYVPDTIVGSTSSGGFEIRAKNSTSPNVDYPSIPTGTHTLKIIAIDASSIGVWASLKP